MTEASESMPGRLSPARSVRRRQFLHLAPALARMFSRGSDMDRFDAILALRGEVFRDHKHRRTMRVEIEGRRYFLKIHGRTDWLEILKNALRGRWPTLDAEPEVRAVERLTELGVPTLTVAGWGRRGRPPAQIESFLFTEALEGFVHLDEVVRAAEGWPDGARRSFYRRAILETALIARAMHEHGVNHRDCYLCHFMLPERDWSLDRPDTPLNLHVIDLHRAQVRRRVPRRALAKDLSGLLFSAMDVPLETRDLPRFLRAYWGADWKRRARRSQWLLRYIRWRALRLYRNEREKPAPPSD